NSTPLLKAERVMTMDNTFNGVEVPRDLIRWAFEAEKGNVSERTFDTEDHFIVARVADIQPKGTLSLAAAKPQMEARVRNEVKAKMLTEKLNNALNGASSIDQVAQKLGKPAVDIENIVLANPVLPGIAMEPAVVGTAFGLQLNELSNAVNGEHGVDAVQVTGFVKPAEGGASDISNRKQRLQPARAQRSWGRSYQALQHTADIHDNRIRFSEEIISN